MDTTPKNICKRCLLRDMAEEDLTFIEKYKAAITERVEPSVYEARLRVCKECDLLSSGTCNACGCYVELRALGKLGKCPHKKWQNGIERKK